MNKILTTIAAAGMLAAPLFAVQKATDLASGQKIVKDSGYALFAYAADWDKKSKKQAEALLASPEVQKALGDRVCIMFPVYEAKDMGPIIKEQLGDPKKPGSIRVPESEQFPSLSYPAIYLCRKDGSRWASVWGDVMYEAKPAEVAKVINEFTATHAKVEPLLAKAAKAEGVEKARLLGEACEIARPASLIKSGSCMHWPENVKDLVKKADPENKSGYVTMLSHDTSGYAENNRQKPLEFIAELEKLATGPGYNTFQKQHFYALAIGLLHRQGKNTPESLARIKELAQKMKALDPKSTLGRSADIAPVVWGPDLTLVGGWKPTCIPKAGEPVKVLGAIPITAPGTYTVGFWFNGGSKGLVIRSVELRDGGKSVDKDEHRGFSGHKKENNVYILKVTSPLKNPELYCTFDMQPNDNSFGRIEVKKVN